MCRVPDSGVHGCLAINVPEEGDLDVTHPSRPTIVITVGFYVDHSAIVLDEVHNQSFAMPDQPPCHGEAPAHRGSWAMSPPTGSRPSSTGSPPGRSESVMSDHLAPFALQAAFPPSLAGRYSGDYYGASVAIGLASRRRSHVRPGRT
jgi:hypothetical protein